MTQEQKQLIYEISTQLIDEIIESATKIVFSNSFKDIHVGKTKFEFYNEWVSNILDVVEGMEAHDSEKKFIIAPPNISMIFTFSKDMKPAEASEIIGPYIAGTLRDNIVLIIAPQLTGDELYLKTSQEVIKVDIDN